MNREDIIRMAREAGLEVHPRKEQVRVGMDALLGIDSTEKVERFAALVSAAERDANSKARAGKPRQLPRLGMGMLHREQQHCFEMGWKEGAAAVRAAIRARGQACPPCTGDCNQGRTCPARSA